MKKFLSMLLAAVMLMIVMPLSVAAAENGNFEPEELIALACEAFPEYEDAIRGETSTAFSHTRTSDSREIVFSETRAISANESIGITQYAGGDVVIVYSDSNYTVEKTASSASNVANDIIGSASFQVTCSGISGTFNLKNVGFIIHQDGSGYFTSYGTPSTTNGVSYNTENVTNSTTYIEYPIVFSQSPFIADAFELYFSDGCLHAAMRR